MILSFNTKTKTASSLKVGVYDSVVTEIGFHPDYRDEEAILVRYQLTNEIGKTYDYCEIFFNSESNKRSQAFFAYLVKNGIPLEGFTSFKGCHEKLELKKTVRGNRTMLTIADRQFVFHSEGDVNDV